MQIKFFDYWDTTRELEWNFHLGVFGFRFGTHQIAFWVNYKPVFDFKLQERICSCCQEIEV